MRLATWITAPFSQPTTLPTPAPIEATPVKIDSAPVTEGHDDSVIIFRSMLLKTQKDGCDLVATFDHLAMIHPKVAAKIVRGGSLGAKTQEKALASLREYGKTSVAMAPALGA